MKIDVKSAAMGAGVVTGLYGLVKGIRYFFFNPEKKEKKNEKKAEDKKAEDKKENAA